MRGCFQPWALRSSSTLGRPDPAEVPDGQGKPRLLRERNRPPPWRATQGCRGGPRERRGRRRRAPPGWPRDDLDDGPDLHRAQYGWERAAWFAFHILASDLTTSGVAPEYITMDW